MGKHTDKLIKVDVVSPVRILDIAGKEIVFYKIISTFDNDTHGVYQIANYRRYNEFFGMHASLEEHFEGDHLKEMLPSPPPKQLLFLVNHTSPEFISGRKAKLSQYLKELLKLPRILNTKVFLNFLGWFPKGLREVTLLLKSIFQLYLLEGELLVKLKDTKGKSESPALINEFLTNKKGHKGEVELSRQVQPGDVICRINGELTGGMSYNDIKATIIRGDRPILISFLGENPYIGLDGEMKNRNSDFVPQDSDSSSDEDSDSEEEKPKKSKKSRRKMSDDDSSEEEKPKKSKKSKKSKRKMSDDDSSEEERPKKAKKSKKHHKKVDSDEEEKPKSKSKKRVSDEEDEDYTV